MLDKGNDDVPSKYLTFIQPAGAQKLNSSIPTDFTYLTLKWICGVRTDPGQLQMVLAPKRLGAQPRFFAQS